MASNIPSISTLDDSRKKDWDLIESQRSWIAYSTYRTTFWIMLILASLVLLSITQGCAVGLNAAAHLELDLTLSSHEAHAAVATCGDPRVMLPLLRAWNPAVADHFYTTNAAEMRNAVSNLGYFPEFTPGYVFITQQPATVPFYRLYHPKIHNHFYTTSAEERNNAIANLGYTSEGVAGYIYSDTTCGGLPLYRSFNGVGDHFYTMSLDEKNNAQANRWNYEGIAGHMFPF